MFRSKIIPKILCCLAALIGFSSTSYAETGRKSLLGMSLSAAEKTEYFGWFQLREIDRQTEAQGQTDWKALPVGRGPPNLYGLRRKTFWELRCDFFEASEHGRRVIAQT